MKTSYQTIQWHITEVCPNRCKHCYIGDVTNEERRCNELRLKEMIMILDNFQKFENKYDAEIKHFVITGGDPFEHPDFKEFLEELNNRNKNITILGIPERISEENIRLLEKYHISQYQMSLDGMSETHDMIRGKGSFEKTIKALKLMNQTSKIYPAIMYTLHQQNCDEMIEVIDYLEQEGIEASFSFDFMVLEGLAKKNFQMLNKYQVDEILEKYRKKKAESRKKHSKLVLREKVKLFETFDIQDANEKFEKYTYISGCYCGLNGCSVLPNGDCLPCRRLPIKIGNLLQQDYTDIF